MLPLRRAAFAILVAMISLVQVLAAPSSPPGTVNITAGSVTTPVVVAPGLSQIAKFEDAVGMPVTGQPINHYMNIYWKGMSLAKTKDSLDENLEGLAPNSPPNFASFSPEDNVTKQQGVPQMTTVYEDSTVASFNLHAFFYGCTTDELLPASCEITIFGYNSTDEQVNEQTFNFEADGREQQMRKAVANEFNNVKMVKFEIGPEGTEAIAYIDSVEYEVFGSRGSCVGEVSCEGEPQTP